MTLKSNNSPQSSVSTAAVSVIFMKIWYREMHAGCAVNVLVLRFCLCAPVWDKSFSTTVLIYMQRVWKWQHGI